MPPATRYSREDWEARYVDESGQLRYPGNEGAVTGRRCDFTGVEEFQPTTATCWIGSGARAGGYLSLPGTPFEERALPPGSLASALPDDAAYRRTASGLQDRGL